MENQKNDCCSTEHGCCKKTIVMIVGILVLGTIVSFAILRDRIVNPQFRQVTVTGQGKVTYTPDQAIVNLGVQIDKLPKAEDALNQLNTKVKAISDAIKKLGVAEGDIKTSNYSLYTQYDYKNNISTVSGYNANQQLAIKVKNITANKDLLTKVIAEATKAGANQVNGVNFEASDLESLKQQARILAIADAQKKSLALASAAGIQLGNISGWYENFISGNPQPYVDYGKGGMGGASSATPAPQINTTDNELIMEIGVNYNIK